MKKGVFAQLLFFGIIINILLVSAAPEHEAEHIFKLKKSRHWVDSVYRNLSPRERIAQLFIVAAYSKTSKPDTAFEALIKKENIGGIIFFQGTPYNQALLTNYYQSIAKTPLMISIDGEWGVAMRLDSVERFPFQMTLGAIQDNNLIEETGKHIAMQCNRLGIHIDYAPVIDINNNPANPVINYRSFGENKYNVAQKGVSFIKGMESRRVLANAKHFPGHGDTDVDSHYGLPVLTQSRSRLDSLEIYPFVQAFNAGVKSVMVAHLNIPAIDDRVEIASSISKKVVKDILIDSLNYNGLILTDALNMKGVANYHKPGALEVKALEAGNDILLCSKNVSLAIDSIQVAIDKGIITQKEINARCKKMLHAKYWAGLNKPKRVEEKNITLDLFPLESKILKRKLFQEALTLLENKNNIIPLKALDTLNIASISFGSSSNNAFQQMLFNYSPSQNYAFEMNQLPKDTALNNFISKLKNHNLVVIGIHAPSRQASKNYGVDTNLFQTIAQIAQEKKVILCVFGNPYMLNKMISSDNIQAVLIGYEGNDIVQEITVQALFGGMPIKGRLPVRIANKYPCGSGINQDQIIRLKYTLPEEANMDGLLLNKVDSIANAAIKVKAFPGCQVLVARKGAVVYNKSFGYHTFDTLVPVANDHIYDIASVTKLSAGTLAIMKLIDEGKINLDTAISKYIDIPAKSDVAKLNLKEIMAHNARFVPYISFYKQMLTDVSSNQQVFANTYSDKYSVRLAENLYISAKYKDSIYNKIYSTPLLDKNGYRYSDLGFYIIPKIVEAQSKEPFQHMLNKSYYAKLGLSTLQFNPRDNYPYDKIVETENDTYFRKQLLKGYVHDQGAAMLGGISGHAGLFSNANDLAIIMQMLLNKGTYGGNVYFSDSVFNIFNTRYFDSLGNRRALGFDKPLLIPGNGAACISASQESFGHTGFTGTMVWADPKQELIFIFLSNRIHPTAANNKITDLDIRTKIHQAIYNAIKKEN